MAGIFLEVVNRSIAAGWLVLAVVLLRFVLRKGPKWINLLLWGMVALRLLFPVTIESSFSLIPDARPISEGFAGEVYSAADFAGENEAGEAASFQGEREIRRTAERTGFRGGGIWGKITQQNGLAEGGLWGVWKEPNSILILTAIWLSGAGLMLFYAVFSYLGLRRQVRTAVLFRDNIFCSEGVESPFVLGVIKPRIYLPFQMQERHLELVALHEQIHIRRGDHLWKPLGFGLLALYWFHPLLWLAYVLLCRDIELACDESVLRGLDRERRADYSQALLDCSTRSRGMGVCPLAFGESGVKTRVKSVLHYRKPTFWALAAALAACGAAAVCFLTNPVRRDTLVWAQTLEAEEVAEAEVVIYSGLGRQSKQLAKNDIDVMVSLIQQSRGRYVEEPEDLDGGSIFFSLTMADGSVHEVGNMGNTYLIIDWDYYEADYSWLSSWNDVLPEGEGLLLEAVIWEEADLDRDGEPEVIRVRETVKGEAYVLEVLKKDGTLLWSEEAGTSHAGWNTLLLYQEGEKDFLIRYHPNLSQGFGSYTCEQFSLAGGVETPENTWEADFELASGQVTGKMRAFAVWANEFLEEGTVLISTQDGQLAVGPRRAEELSGLYPVRFYPEETEPAEGVWKDFAKGLTEEVEPLEFVLASGAGAWSTSLTLYPDGSFQGTYAGNEAVAGESYPRGTVYICRFSGKFGDIRETGEYSFSMRLAELDYETEEEAVWIEDGFRFIGAGAVGLEEGEEFIFYLPGVPMEELEEDFVTWSPDYYLWKNGGIERLSAYGIYNVEAECGFFTNWGD